MEEAVGDWTPKEEGPQEMQLQLRLLRDSSPGSLSDCESSGTKCWSSELSKWEAATPLLHQRWLSQIEYHPRWAWPSSFF